MSLSNDRIKLIDRIVKLLALADGSVGGHEAESARRMAAELMAKHNIASHDIKGEEVFTEFEHVLTVRDPHKFDIALANKIASFNGASIIFNLYGKKAVYVYVGTRSDIEASRYMLGVVTSQRKAAYTRFNLDYVRAYGREDTDKIWRGWHNGFTMGVCAKLVELEKMCNAKIQEWGLVPVNNSAVALNWYKENNPVKETAGKKLSGLRSGFEAGKSVSINKGVEANSSVKKIA